MRPDAPVQADLHHAAAGACGVQHRAAFVDGVAGGLLDEDMRARLERGDGLQGVPMIRRGDDDDLGLLLLQQLAVIVVGLGLVAAQIVHLLGRHFAPAFVHVAEGDDFHASAFHRLLEDILAPPTGADERGAELLPRLGSAQQIRRGGEGGSRRGGGELDELAALHGGSKAGRPAGEKRMCNLTGRPGRKAWLLKSQLGPVRPVRLSPRKKLYVSRRSSSSI